MQGGRPETCRALDHAQAKKRCKGADNKGFPEDILSFADAFVSLQDLRHRADYDPEAAFTRSEVLNHLGIARRALEALQRARVEDRRALAAHVLLPYRD